MIRAAVKRIFPPSDTEAAAWRSAWLAERLQREQRGLPNVWWRRALRRALAGQTSARRTYNLPPARWLAARALRIRLIDVGLRFAALPAEFDGFTIVQLSDLHLDHVDGIAAAIIAAVRGMRCDLVAITGDFQDAQRQGPAQIAGSIKAILSVIESANGAVGVLGNHDRGALVEPLEQAGVTMLLNEVVELRRGAGRLLLTGTDDVHYFHTPRADRALASCPDGFAIALVHSPEAADEAAARHDLMLCGHTHGGQICLPGGYAPVRALKRNRRYYRGVWRHGDMAGFTTSGIGTSVVPFRFFCPAEIARITLRRA